MVDDHSIQLDLVRHTNQGLSRLLFWSTYISFFVFVIVFVVFDDVPFFLILFPAVPAIASYINHHFIDNYNVVGSIIYKDQKIMIKADDLQMEESLDDLSDFKIHIDGFEGEPYLFHIVRDRSMNFHTGVDNYISFKQGDDTVRIYFRLSNNMTKDRLIRIFNELNPHYIVCHE